MPTTSLYNRSVIYFAQKIVSEYKHRCDHNKNNFILTLVFKKRDAFIYMQSHAIEQASPLT